MFSKHGILITGANGFLGYYLCRDLLEKGYNVIATGKGECRLPFPAENNFVYAAMDFTDPFPVHDLFEKYQPSIVIHAGAMSRVDDCEQQQWQAYVSNVEGTLTLLINAAEYKSFFIFLSTDFIFDGKKGMYKEEDSPGPVNFYGKTKLEAEEAVKEYDFDWAIARTVLVYGKNHSGRKNILALISEKLQKEGKYQAFDDQVRTPTYVEDLSRGILSIVEKRAKGVYHISGKDMLTPYKMACLAAKESGLDASLILPITAKDLVQPARRPLKTGFDIEKAKKDLSYEPLSFSEGLKKTFS